MRKLTGWTFALVVLIAGAAVAAEHKMVPEEGAVQVMLLRQASVREDLKLSHNEADKIDKFTSDQWKKAKEINKLPETEHDKKFKEFTKENERFIDQNLTKEQRKRLKEIELQTAGLLCVTRHDVAKQLKLTDEQLQRAKGMQQEARQEMEEFIYNSKPESRVEKLAQLRRTSHDRLYQLLTDEQEKTWAEMIGEPFKGEFHFGPKNTAAK